MFLGGPPLVKMATGEESDDETLGGAVMHGTRSGLADFVAADERDALRLAREVLARVGAGCRGRAGTARPGGGGAAVRRRGAARRRQRRPAGALRPARDPGPDRRRLRVRRVQARATAPRW